MGLKKRGAEEKLRKQQEEAERRAREKLERRKLEEAAKAQAAKQETKFQAQQKVPPKNPKSSSGKGILVFSLIFGVLLIGAAAIFLGSNGDFAQTEPLQMETYTNSIGMKFVEIPAGEFMMGSPPYYEGLYYNYGPVHKVTIEESYYLGKFEVTQEQWREVMGNNPSNFTGDDLPVEQVSWNDVQVFIEKLNEMEGTNKYCLPSEAEWEYACCAGTTTRYYFGDDELELGDYAWYSSNSDETHPVGQKKPNPWGLYDMHGNVCEWVQDRWHDDYDGAPSDGSAWGSGSGSRRVIRGGSWFGISRGCRSASRNGGPSGHYDDLGFRVLRKL